MKLYCTSFLSVFELYQDDKKNDKKAFEQHSALKSWKDP